MEEARFTVQEEFTNGWHSVIENAPKEQCKKKYEECLENGTSPDRLRIIRVS